MKLSIAIESVRQPGVIVLIEASDRYSLERYPPEGHFGTDIDGLDRPDILFAVARLENRIVGCGAIKLEADGTGELKRLFVDDAGRGRGVGKALMVFLEALAADRKVAVLNLETGPLNTEAVKLYQAFGYAECGPFGSYEDNPYSLFMTKKLA